METSKKNVVFALLTGAVLGTVLGLLYAPQKGSKTRQLIKDTTADTTRELNEKIKSVKDDIATAAHERKVEFEKSLNMAISNLADRSDAIIAALEKKLEAFKK